MSAIDRAIEALETDRKACGACRFSAGVWRSCTYHEGMADGVELANSSPSIGEEPAREEVTPLKAIQLDDGTTYAEVNQTFFVNEGDSEWGGQRGRVYGNCWQASIASYFAMSIDAVPAFAQFTWPNPAIELWARGIGMTHKYEVTNTIPDRLCIVEGHSPRGGLHGVLGYGGKIIWDPHPSRAGLLDVTMVEWFEKWPNEDRAC